MSYAKRSKEHFEAALEMERILSKMSPNDPAYKHYQEQKEYYLKEACEAEKKGW